MNKQPKFDYSDIKFKDNGKLKLIIVVGTRPEIIRLAAVINKCRQYFDVILAHTGQNYDYNLNGIFFKDLKLAEPEVYMDAVGDDLGATCGNIINCSAQSSLPLSTHSHQHNQAQEYHADRHGKAQLQYLQPGAKTSRRYQR